MQFVSMVVCGCGNNAMAAGPENHRHQIEKGRKSGLIGCGTAVINKSLRPFVKCRFFFSRNSGGKEIKKKTWKVTSSFCLGFSLHSFSICNFAKTKNHCVWKWLEKVSFYNITSEASYLQISNRRKETLKLDFFDWFFPFWKC